MLSRPDKVRKRHAKVVKLAIRKYRTTYDSSFSSSELLTYSDFARAQSMTDAQVEYVKYFGKLKKWHPRKGDTAATTTKKLLLEVIRTTRKALR